MSKEVHIVSYNSLNELCIYTDIDKSNIFGDLYGENNKYEAIVLPNGNYACGIAYYDHGIKPQIIAKENSVLFIGFDKTIIRLDYLSEILIIHKKLSSLFYEIIDVDSQSLIIIICELDVYVIDNAGELVWNIGFRDIIIEFNVINNKLFIKCEDGDETTFLIKNGSVVQ